MKSENSKENKNISTKQKIKSCLIEAALSSTFHGIDKIVKGH